MERPFHITGQCVASDEELFDNIRKACARGLPEVGGPVALVGSGPSVAGQLEKLFEFQAQGIPIVAIKDAHDWLIEHGLTLDAAFALDPQEHRWNCFKRKHSGVHYYIASQCHPAMFEHLQGHKVTLCHMHVKKGQSEPQGLLIGGGTTSGLRAISLFYTMGHRVFHLFGFDSCLSGDALRVDGAGIKPDQRTIEVTLGDGKPYITTGNMAQQASDFQDVYRLMPDAIFHGYGDGLIQAIIAQRKKDAAELKTFLQQRPQPDNGRVSFIHKMDERSASYRYRSLIPSQECEASLNDLTASTLIFSKIEPQELMEMGRAKARGQYLIADFCDDHFQMMHYQEALRLAHAVTCSTQVMRERIALRGRDATVIPDPWEYPLEPPHCQGTNLLWFGHHVNRAGLQRILPDLAGWPLVVIGNFGGAIPWSKETMLQAFAAADIVVIPATEEYKSCNRTVESLRQGCFVVAEPHPSIMDIPGIWIGNIKEGIEWAQQNPEQARQRTATAASYVTEKYSPQTVASAWKNVIRSRTTSAVAELAGVAG